MHSFEVHSNESACRKKVPSWAGTSLIWKYYNKFTHIYEDAPWFGILSSVVFVIQSTENSPKVYTTVQLVFGFDMILLTKNTMYW